MGTRMQDQGRAVLDALDEGRFVGMLELLKHESPGITNGEAIRRMEEVGTIEDLGYWMEWFKLNREQLSLGERRVGDAEVAGSNPVSLIGKRSDDV